MNAIESAKQANLKRYEARKEKKRKEKAEKIKKSEHRDK